MNERGGASFNCTASQDILLKPPPLETGHFGIPDHRLVIQCSASSELSKSRFGEVTARSRFGELQLLARELDRQLVCHTHTMRRDLESSTD